jgi:hypothetical protein
MATRMKHMRGLIGADGGGEGEEQRHVGSCLAAQGTGLAAKGRVKAEAVATGGEDVWLLVLLNAAGSGNK